MQYPITFHLEMGSVCFDLDLDLVVSTVNCNCNCEASPHSCTLTLPRPQERTPLTLKAPWHVLDDDDMAPATNISFFNLNMTRRRIATVVRRGRDAERPRSAGRRIQQRRRPSIRDPTAARAPGVAGINGGRLVGDGRREGGAVEWS